MHIIEVRIVSKDDGHTVETLADGVLIHTVGPFSDLDSAKLMAADVERRARASREELNMRASEHEKPPH
jgi:hypothetical protein